MPLVGDSLALSRAEAEVRSLITRVYGWMAGGLVLTALVAMLVAATPALVVAIVATKWLFYGLLLAELGLVVWLSGWVHRMSGALATAVFLAYAALNGVTLSVVFLAFTAGSLASTFFITGGTFGAMSAIGYYTRRDLTSIGNLCFMALIGLILASVVNFFFQNELLYWISTYAGVLIFVGLTAYDTQKIKRMSAAAAGSEDTETGRKAAILGALALYLDFINLFLLLLRIFGRRR